MRLPQVPYVIKQKQSEIVQIRGINYSADYEEGALAESRNISTRHFPYFSTRRKRKLLENYAQATALTAWNKLIVVQNGRLFYDGKDVGAVSDGEKQFAVVNTKLVIWPDKVYYDIDEKVIKPLGAKASGSGLPTVRANPLRSTRPTTNPRKPIMSPARSLPAPGRKTSRATPSFTVPMPNPTPWNML